MIEVFFVVVIAWFILSFKRCLDGWVALEFLGSVFYTFSFGFRGLFQHALAKIEH